MSQSFEVALFPIPNVVAFPGMIVPLHVFEPRYRTMITDCVEKDRMIAVSHTLKEIRPAKVDQSMKDALSSNQATYESQPVFSAGPCKIMETTPDGRIYINIRMEKRLRYLEEIQTLPYQIVSCEEVDDLPVSSTDASERAAELQREIVSEILKIIGRQNPAGLARFDSDHWRVMDTTDFSFRVFQLLRLDSDVMQAVLEMTSPLERLEVIDAVLRNQE
ncbi:MAG: LON peptidase substrate-binding domain-containing protein [Pseudomonadales bacterium]|nr:LON peptidase substrate-binding domain-containing protein [Pseudomonadales bacterium]